MNSRFTTPSFESAPNQTTLFEAVKRHHKRAVLTFLLVAALFAAAIAYWPRTYRSEGKLFIRPTVKPAAEDPTATKEYSIGVANEAREFEVNSVVDMLQSHKIAAAIVDQIGPGMILQQSEVAAAAASELSSTANNSAEAENSRDRESAIRALTKSLAISSPKKSTVIDISCDTWSPQLSQQIVALLMDIYLQEHVRVNRVDGSYHFFQEQVQLLEKELNDATEKLRATKSENDLASVIGKRASFEQQVTAIELQITDNQRQESASEAKIKSLQATIEILPEAVVTQDVTGLPNNAADAMRAELFRQEARLFDLLAKYTPTHPEVRAVSEQVSELQEIVKGQDPERIQTTTGRSPERQTLLVSMLAEQAALDAAEARLEKLGEQHALVLNELRNLNAAEVRIADLERRMQLADANYRSYAQKLEQARMHNALEIERISNVKIVQPATLVNKPVSPNTLLLLVVGLFMGTVSGVAVAVVSDRTDPTLRTREDIEQQFALPILVSIPRVKRPEIHSN